jgi:hypothetical protein
MRAMKCAGHADPDGLVSGWRNVSGRVDSEQLDGLVCMRAEGQPVHGDAMGVLLLALSSTHSYSQTEEVFSGDERLAAYKAFLQLALTSALSPVRRAQTRSCLQLITTNR